MPPRCALGGVRCSHFGQEGKERIGIVTATELVAGGLIAQMARHPRQGFQMIGASWLWCKQEKDQIDRLVINRIKIDRLGEAGKEANHLVEVLELAVWDGDAVAHTGGAKTLTLEQFVEDIPDFETGDLGSTGCQLLQGLPSEIVNIAAEALSSPQGQQMKVMIENMEKGMRQGAG